MDATAIVLREPIREEAVIDAICAELARRGIAVYVSKYIEPDRP